MASTSDITAVCELSAAHTANVSTEFRWSVAAACTMRLVIALALVFLCAQASVPENAPVISSIDSEELDPLTAATLETFGGFLDDDDTDEEALDEEEEDFVPDEEYEEIVHAEVTEDGMIAVEDMIMSPEMFEVVYPAAVDHPENGENQTVHRRAALSSRSKFWPGGRIPYAYNSNLAGSQSKVRAAMDEWEKYSCVKFEYRKSSETRYVQIRTPVDSSGKKLKICSATLGYTGRKQYVNLAKNCFAHKTILHELGHSMGLIHEHQHPSRDKYVTIIWDNIEPVKKHNFNPKTGISSWGITYDPTSIMHYRSTAFKKSGCRSPCYTITSKLGSSTTRVMGTATHLSTKSDIPIINKIYCGK